MIYVPIREARRGPGIRAGISRPAFLLATTASPSFSVFQVNDDHRGQQVEAGDPVVLSFPGSVSQFAALVEVDGALEGMVRLALFNPTWARRRMSGRWVSTVISRSRTVAERFSHGGKDGIRGGSPTRPLTSARAVCPTADREVNRSAHYPTQGPSPVPAQPRSIPWHDDVERQRVAVRAGEGAFDGARAGRHVVALRDLNPDLVDRLRRIQGTGSTTVKPGRHNGWSIPSITGLRGQQ